MDEFKLMESPQKMADLTRVEYPCYVQPKLDGYRAVYLPGEGLVSKTGKAFRNVNLAAYFENLYKTTNYVFDGELYIHGDFDAVAAVRSDNNSIPIGLTYYVYDVLNTSEWYGRKCNKIYKERIQDIRGLVPLIDKKEKKFVGISNDYAENPKQVVDLYKDYLTKGYEGIIIRDVNSEYVWKRTTNRSGEVLRLKPFKSMDLIVIDMIHGKGKFEGTLGSLVVNFKGNRVNIGTGFTTEQRKEIWESDPLGKLIEIRYFDETGQSLLQPRFLRFRNDK